MNRKYIVLLGTFLIASTTGAVGGSCWGTNTPPDMFVPADRFFVDGLIFEDLNGNGQFDYEDGDKGIPNKDFVIVDEGASYQDFDNQFLASGRTDSNGWFRLSVQPPAGTNLSRALAVSVREPNGGQRLSAAVAYRVMMPAMATIESEQIVCLKFMPGFWPNAYALMPRAEDGLITLSEPLQRHLFEMSMRTRVADHVELKFRGLGISVFRTSMFQSCESAPARTQIVTFHAGCKTGETLSGSSGCPTAGETMPATADGFLDIGNQFWDDEVNVYWGGVFTVTEKFDLFHETPAAWDGSEDIARAVANVAVHELGHALGLVAPEFPDSHHGHNYEYASTSPFGSPFAGLGPIRSPERRIMNAGGQYKAQAKRAYHLTETVLVWQGLTMVRRPVRAPMVFNDVNRQYLEAVFPE